MLTHARDLEKELGREPHDQARFDHAAKALLADLKAEDDSTLEERLHEDRFRIETWIRGIALMVVVVALVGLPIYAMMFNITAENLALYMAPITGITGAIIGYWFGQSGMTPGQKRNARSGR